MIIPILFAITMICLAFAIHPVFGIVMIPWCIIVFIAMMLKHPDMRP